LGAGLFADFGVENDVEVGVEVVTETCGGGGCTVISLGSSLIAF